MSDYFGDQEKPVNKYDRKPGPNMKNRPLGKQINKISAD